MKILGFFGFQIFLMACAFFSCEKNSRFFMHKNGNTILMIFC